MLNIGHGQSQLDRYDMAIYILLAIESVIRTREPCFLCLWSFSVAPAFGWQSPMVAV